jgi:hypothetical protein
MFWLLCRKVWEKTYVGKMVISIFWSKDIRSKDIQSNDNLSTDIWSNDIWLTEIWCTDTWPLKFFVKNNVCLIELSTLSFADNWWRNFSFSVCLLTKCQLTKWLWTKCQSTKCQSTKWLWTKRGETQKVFGVKKLSFLCMRELWTCVLPI